MHLLCYSGCTLRQLLRGLSHARVVYAAPRGDFGVVECRRPLMRSFFDMLYLSFCFFAGDFAGLLHGSASLKTSSLGRERVRVENSIVWWITRARRP
jgi:hypothetical protein